MAYFWTNLLETFAALVDSGNVEAAAERVRRSLTVVDVHIDELEKFAAGRCSIDAAMWRT
ncbi:helix-turn-helix domain-containing protein [Marinivivus vitaminiproducens]|uniref:helix-turn-helix domain-containing protein n=1 Tax=Marinivivus vitaminiproducens TaxID=3035935 RepID=UPI0027A11520|nr:LysR family transcriptional regulator [Geminicoccaceae bacterium SCSIO 64248]